MEPNELRAYSRSTGGWGEVGGLPHHDRYALPVRPRSRRRCHCGCGKRATHLGCANGMALTVGCEWYVRRWINERR